MQKLFILFFLVNILHYNSFSQVETPKRRNFNIGISDGIGGSYFFKLIPALDLRYKNINLRIAPQPGAIGGGVSYEILPFFKVSKDAFWIVSAYGSYGTYTQQAVYNSSDSNFVNSQGKYYSAMLMTGAKLYLGSRVYSQLQIGVIHSNINGLIKYNNSKFTSLYLEFSLGINLFANYKKAEEIGVEAE